ncbi:MAG: hypothetical protein DWQ04_30795 [Chloroflexi bacterium]|nr:MAG: hypothetical protein DWQ04_30795 [Chloroflexota bacterium]
MNDVLTQLQAANAELEPQFKAFRGVMGALKMATRLASEEKADALPMHKALIKLETAAAEVESEVLDTAVSAFATVTKSALDDLAFEFAKDLREVFADRGEEVAGRPPTVTVGILTLKIDIAARKGQWLYGKEPLTRPIPLSLKGILRAYDQQVRRIVNREVKAEALVQELYEAWEDCINKKDRRPSGGRINIVQVYSQLTLNRQSARFWNAPSRRTFKDYERDLFVRDMTLLQEQNATSFTVDGETRQFRLGVATKSQAEQTNRSIWLPQDAVEGQYYSDITFD